jgi:hypothetical protein
MDVRRPITLAAFTLLAAILAACAPGSMASRGATSGAKQGALGGAVAGAVGSIFWGGNVLENAAASAAIGAASGAAMGAASGSSVDKEVAAKRQMSEQDAAIAQKLGPANFDAAVALAECKHKRAMGLARTAYGTVGDDEHRRYALMIEAIAAEESGDTAAASEVYPLLLRADPSLGSTDRARSEALAGILKIQRVREEHGRAPTCG